MRNPMLWLIAGSIVLALFFTLDVTAQPVRQQPQWEYATFRTTDLGFIYREPTWNMASSTGRGNQRSLGDLLHFLGAERTEHVTFFQLLNALGANGWEIVQYEEQGQDLTMLLKRQK